MAFKLFPILNMMIDFYHQPIGFDRFENYLKILKGDSKDDMEVPIPYFNPMGEDHILAKLERFKELHIEEIIQEVLAEINTRYSISDIFEINTVMALADDLKGGWTNRYTTDYDTKFKLNAYVNRNFCIIVFWTSESYDINTIKRRIEEYCLRTLYWKKGNKPQSLEEHIEQEVFVSKGCKAPFGHPNLIDFNSVNAYFENNRNSTEHSLIFNFMYGDDHCNELGYPELGISEKMTGFKYAEMKSKL